LRKVKGRDRGRERINVLVCWVTEGKRKHGMERESIVWACWVNSLVQGAVILQSVHPAHLFT
jgi:hypothetical protein